MPEACDPFEYLGPALLALRERVRMSQRDAGAVAGVSAGNISRYEKGSVRPTIPVLSRLLMAYGASAAVLAAEMESAGAATQTRESGGGGTPLVGAESGVDLDSAVERVLRRLGYDPPARSDRGDKEMLSAAV